MPFPGRWWSEYHFQETTPFISIITIKLKCLIPFVILAPYNAFSACPHRPSKFHRAFLSVAYIKKASILKIMFQIMSLHLRIFFTELTANERKMACLILEQDLP